MSLLKSHIYAAQLNPNTQDKIHMKHKTFQTQTQDVPNYFKIVYNLWNSSPKMHSFPKIQSENISHRPERSSQEKEMRAQVADMLSALQVQADALSERLVCPPPGATKSVSFFQKCRVERLDDNSRRLDDSPNVSFYVWCFPNTFQSELFLSYGAAFFYMYPVVWFQYFDDVL